MKIEQAIAAYYQSPDELRLADYVRSPNTATMSHGYNTYFPSLYHAIKRYKLDL